MDTLTPGVAALLCTNFLGLTVKRVRILELTDEQGRVIPTCGEDNKAALRRSTGVARSRDRYLVSPHLV